MTEPGSTGTSEAQRPWTWTWDRLLVEPRRPQVIRERPNAPWFAVAAVCVGAFMGQLDASIVTVALPTLQRTFNASVGAVTWVGLSYLLVLVATVTAVGRFADMWGRKLLYVYGFVIFTVASALCGLAPSLGALCGFRALQAIGAAMLQANSLAIIVLVMPARSLGRAIGLQGAAQALGLALGPTVGGLLLAVSGWRLIFFVNVPFGVFGAVAAILLVPRSRNLQARVGFDWTGLALFFPAMAALLSAISFGAQDGWSSALIAGLFCAAVVLLVVFVWWERREREPMLDLGLFRSGRFSTGIASGMGAYLVMFGVLLLVPFYFERGLGYGTLRSGLSLMAMPLAFGVVAPLAGRVADRVGARPLTVSGMAIVAGSLGILAALRPPTAGFLALLAALGVGMGLFTSPNNASIMGAAPEQQAGMASGVLNMTRGMGTALGLALTGSVFTIAGGDKGSMAGAAHAFSVTAWVLAAIAAGAGVVSALRANGTLASATLSSVE
jgi:EmrB/QacA subfamily drug resistance transporter